MLESKRQVEFEKLRFDGVYHQIEQGDYHLKTILNEGEHYGILDTPFISNSIYFFQNRYVVLSGRYQDSVNYLKTQLAWGTQKRSFINEWGVYDISRNYINAIIYITFMGEPFKGRTERVLCNFQGLIKNRDTILNWHMIPPYPNVPMYPNEEYFKKLTTPRDLYFKKVPVQELIDPTKAWINKFKKDSLLTRKN